MGYLEQEPQMDDEKTVLEVVRGVAETVAILDEYNQINDQFGLPEVYENADKMQQLMDRQAQLQDEIDAVNMELDMIGAMDALHAPVIKKLGSYGEKDVVSLCAVYYFKNQTYYF